MTNEIIIDGEKYLEINGKMYKLIPNDQPFSLTDKQKKNKKKEKFFIKVR